MKTRNNKRRQKSELSYGSLEQRNLLAGFTYGADYVSVSGTNYSDNVSVYDSSGGFRVSLNGEYTSLLSKSQYTRVFFYGHKGDDVFNNSTNVTSIAHGQDGNDRLSGGSGRDYFYGEDGEDYLSGRGGNDKLVGGNHDDTLYGGSGEDRLYGQNGNDLLSGGSGNDLVSGNAGNDRVYGSDGNDKVYGGDGDDVVSGNDGDDRIYAGADDDRVYGGNGDDYLNGGSGNDRIEGGDDHDRIYGSTGNDFINGGAGNDLVSGNDGSDKVYGSDGNDRVYGGDGNDIVSGNDGNDWVYGNSGVDKVYGGAGHDVLYGGSGDDTIWGYTGNDRLYGEDGEDTLYGYKGHDNLYGGSDSDKLYGGDGLDGLYGGPDVDTVHGGSGADRFLHFGNDTIQDKTSIDARIRFSQNRENWNSGEVEVMDRAFAQLHYRTGNTRLLKDYYTGRDLFFLKAPTSESWVGLNRTYTTSSGTKMREIHIKDWNTTVESENLARIYTAIHEIGHNWDSYSEVNSAMSGYGYLVTNFRNISGWSTSYSSGKVRSLDGDWYHNSHASFARDYGKTNPREDMATVWQAYFKLRNGDASGYSGLNSKLQAVDNIFSRLSTFS